VNMGFQEMFEPHGSKAPSLAEAVRLSKGAGLPMPEVAPMTVENIREAMGWYFPKATDWDTVVYPFENVQLAARERKPVVDTVQSGFMIGFVFITNNPLCGYDIHLETKTSTVSYKNTPADLYDLGILDNMNNVVEWLVRYDPVSSLYVVALTPATWFPFHGRSICTLDNTRSPTVSTVLKFLWSVLLVY